MTSGDVLRCPARTEHEDQKLVPEGANFYCPGCHGIRTPARNSVTAHSDQCGRVWRALCGQCDCQMSKYWAKGTTKLMQPFMRAVNAVRRATVHGAAAAVPPQFEQQTSLKLYSEYAW